MKKKIVGLFIATVVAVNFIAPPAAHAGSKTIRLRSVVKSSLSKTEQNSIASGKITLTANDANSEFLLAYQGGGRLAETGSDARILVAYFAVGGLLAALGGYFLLRSKKGRALLLLAVSVGGLALNNQAASAIIDSIGATDTVTVQDGESVEYSPPKIDGYEYLGYAKRPVSAASTNNNTTPNPTPTPTPTPSPTVPAAAGKYNRLAFEDNFDSISTIDTGNTGAPGFKWYPAGVHKWGKPDTQPSEYSVNNSVLRIAPSHSTYNRNFMTRDPNTGEGRSFGRGYYEVRMRVDADGVRNVPPENSSWPAFWAQSNHLHRLNQRPYVELDMVEIMRKDEFLGTLWAHHGGQFDKSLMIKNRKADYRNPNYHSADWHTY
ncbi:MAG: hypothetical protein HXL04_02440, partial [Candidatus Nanosynbacter sp.]|nr:hypothetical protein [Candidatus Nanosynbacter sp.]